MSERSPSGARDPRRAAARFEVSAAGGVRLQAYRWEPPAGADGGTTLILVHGLGEHAGRYAPLLDALLGAGHRVVAYDQRGHGGSDGRRGVLPDFEQLVDDLFAVAASDGAQLPTETLLFGHSMGGLVAIRALQRGGRRWPAAVLSAPWLATGLPVPFWKRALRPWMLRIAPRWTIPAGLRGAHLSRDPERVADRAGDREVHDRVSAGLLGAVERAQRAALEGSLPDGLPVLLIAPGDDPVTDVPLAEAWLRASGADATVTAVPAGRHEPHNDLDREALFAAFLAWIADRGLEPEGRV